MGSGPAEAEASSLGSDQLMRTTRSCASCSVWGASCLIHICRSWGRPFVNPYSMSATDMLLMLSICVLNFCAYALAHVPLVIFWASSPSSLVCFFSTCVECSQFEHQTLIRQERVMYWCCSWQSLGKGQPLTSAKFKNGSALLLLSWRCFRIKFTS